MLQNCFEYSLGKMLQNLASAAVVIDALRVSGISVYMPTDKQNNIKI